MTLTVADRQVVAHDQDVVALTLAAPDARPAAAVASGRPPRRPPAQRTGAAVLAVRRPRGHRRVPDRGAADSGRRRRFDRGARRSAGRRDGDHQRPAQRVSADGARLRLARPAIPLHRRRYRHHADPADAGPWRNGWASTGRWSTPAAAATACPSSTNSTGSATASRSAPTTSVRPSDGRRPARRLPGGHDGIRLRPAPMLTAIRTALAGRDDVELHFERFAAPPVVDGTEFEVTVASTGGDGAGRCRRDTALRAAAGRGARAVLVPAGLLRDVPHPGARWRGRPPRHALDDPGTRRRHDADLHIQSGTRWTTDPRSLGVASRRLARALQ